MRTNFYLRLLHSTNYNSDIFLYQSRFIYLFVTFLHIADYIKTDKMEVSMERRLKNASSRVRHDLSLLPDTVRSYYQLQSKTGIVKKSEIIDFSVAVAEHVVLNHPSIVHEIRPEVKIYGND